MDHSLATATIRDVLPTPSPTPTPVSLPELETRPAAGQEICSPLEGVALVDLPEHITNPYHPPAAGSDDPHQGTDFSILQPGTTIALPGQAVQAVLAGKVAGEIKNRFPYGNAVMIETPLDMVGISPDAFPAAISTLSAVPALTCPPYLERTGWDEQNRSLYLLYAHLQSPPDLTPGDDVHCGQTLGAIGDSGNAINPHLHLEMRVGPANARFPSMAHYDSSASIDEMALYCIWRVSGMFQTIEPMLVLELP
jgi:murein DD-endopeptidase MepM/ murein hydrolase activator NlpD